jgi:hypothetical protein
MMNDEIRTTNCRAAHFIVWTSKFEFDLGIRISGNRDQRLAAEIWLARRHHRPFSLITLDVDLNRAVTRMAILTPMS